MWKKLLAMFCLLYDKSVIHIPKAKHEWIRGSDDGLGFKLFHVQHGYYIAERGTLGCTLFILLTLEEKTGTF